MRICKEILNLVYCSAIVIYRLHQWRDTVQSSLHS